MSRDVVVMIVLTFCEDGDNTKDALDIVSYVNSADKWIPVSSDTTQVYVVYQRIAQLI